MKPLVLLVAVLAASPSVATQAIALSVEGLARSSDSVVRGRVRGMASILSPDGRRIFTLVDVEVLSTWRGDAGKEVQVVVPGGVVGEIGQRVDGAPTFTEGEVVVLFLTRAEAGGHRVAGLAQGKFSVGGGVASPDLSHVRMLSREVRAGERPAEAMSVVELERRVRSVR